MTSSIFRGAQPWNRLYIIQLCPVLCDPMNHSTPGLPVHHQLQKCKLKLPWGVTSHQSKRPSPKNIHIINVEEDVKKKLSYTVFWYYKLMQPVWETIWRFLKKLRIELPSVQFSCSAMSDSVTPWTAAHQASLSITNSHSLLKLMSIELVMPSIQLIFSHPLLLPLSIFPSTRVFSNESVLRIR